MNFEIIKKEITYKAVRSSGAGGQNVNKVSTKIIISFNIQNSEGFSAAQKETLLGKLSNKISTEGDLLITCSDTRSQLKNKQLALDKLYTILEQSLKVKTKRIETKIPKAVIKKRLENKKLNSLKKNLRKNINL